MKVVSVVNLIDEYHTLETLKSTKEWFHDANKQALVLDKYLLENDEFYRLLQDQEYYTEILSEVDSDETLSWSEGVVAATEFLTGSYMTSNEVKETLLNMDPYTILVNYFQWNWFRTHLANSEVLEKIKVLISARGIPLRSTFHYNLGQVVVPSRNYVIIDESAGRFDKWYLQNFFIGHPSTFCNMGLFVSCASSHWNLDALKNYSEKPNPTFLCEPGAIYEALRNNLIWQASELEEEYVHVAIAIFNAIKLFAFPLATVERLMSLIRNDALGESLHTDLLLSKLVSLEDLTGYEKILAQTDKYRVLLSCLVLLGEQTLEFSQESLAKMIIMFGSLRLLTGYKLERLYNSIAELFVTEFMEYLSNAPRGVFITFINDGLDDWFLYLLSSELISRNVLLKTAMKHARFAELTRKAHNMRLESASVVSPEEYTDMQMLINNE